MKNKLIEYLFIIVFLLILLTIIILNDVVFSIIGSLIIMFGCIVMYLFDR